MPPELPSKGTVPEEPVFAATPLWRMTMAEQHGHDTGFGGLLWLVVLGRVLAPLRVGFQIFQQIAAFRAMGGWEAFRALEFENEGATEPFFAALISIGEFGIEFIFDLILLWLLFTFRRAFPKCMLVYYGLSICLMIGTLVSGFAPRANPQLIISILISVAWSIYFLKSERVKRTFVQ